MMRLQFGPARLGPLSLLLLGLMVGAPPARASERVLPVVWTIDETHVGKPDDPGSGAHYLRPDLDSGTYAEAGRMLQPLLFRILLWRIWI